MTANMENRRDHAVTIVRVLAVFLIIACHIADKFEKAAIAQVANVGVPLFLLISGYLYGGKTIDEPGRWFKRKMTQVYAPVVAWTVLQTAYAIAGLKGFMRFSEYAALALILEGIDTIFFRMPPGLVNGPWFFTPIYLCYILVALYSRAEKKHPGVRRAFTPAGAAILYALFAAFVFCGVNISSFLCFYAGFYIGKTGCCRKRRFGMAEAVLLAAISCAVRLIARRFCDGTLFYDYILVPTTHICLACAVFLFVKQFAFRCEACAQAVAGFDAVRFIERISVYIYIFHPQMIFMFRWKLPFIAVLPVYLAAVLAGSAILYAIFEHLRRAAAAKLGL